MSTSSSNRSGFKYSHEAASRGHPILSPFHSVATLVPKLRRNSCSAVSIKTKKRVKWTIPAMSVSTNSILRLVLYSVCMLGIYGCWQSVEWWSVIGFWLRSSRLTKHSCNRQPTTDNHSTTFLENPVHPRIDSTFPRKCASVHRSDLP